jgi:hypothetical protein
MLVMRWQRLVAMEKIPYRYQPFVTQRQHFRVLAASQQS